MEPRKISPILYVVLGVSVGLLVFLLIIINPFGWKLALPSIFNFNRSAGSIPEGLALAPTPHLFLPHGKQTYNARGSGAERSSVTSITFEPLDPAKNTSQTITASVTSKESVKSVTLTVNTDNQSTNHAMKLISGNGSKGDWTSTFTVSDSYEKTYNLSFLIITSFGNKTTQLMPIR